MEEDPFNYGRMIEEALSEVMRQSLLRAEQRGLSGGHHFYLTFRTRAPGVGLPDYLLAKYPDLMTIVLQHQFWGLEVRQNAFSVSLSFANRLERLTVPFAAVTTFADPSVDFALQFGPSEPAAEGAGSVAGEILQLARAQREKPEAAAAGGSALPPQSPEAPAAAEVVTLDQFRKR